MFSTSLISGLVQLLEGHVPREVKHSRFGTWEGVSRVSRTVVVMSPEQLFLFSQLCEISFGFVFFFAACPDEQC